MKIEDLRLKLRLPENGSLKGKRQVVKSIIARTENKFKVSIAEIDDNDLWQLATLGVVCVGNDGRHVNEVLSRVAEFVEAIREDAELLDYEIEILDAL